MSVHAATRAAHARARPIQISLPEPMAARMEERARALGRGLTDYARLLLEAAYAARCALDKGENSYDAALDRQVQLTFLMADCEPDYIAEALGMPKARAQRILEGWRSFASASRDAPAASPPVAPAGRRTTDDARSGAVAAQAGDGEGKALAPAKAGKPADAADTARISLTRKVHGEQIAAMWAEGIKAADIGAAIGSDADRVRKFAEKNRDLCPARPQGKASWSDETVETVRRMWAERFSTAEIAAAIGKTEGAVSVWASKNRHVCPARREGGNWR